MLDPKHALTLRTRPAGQHIMLQEWRNLLFMHFPCEPSLIQALLPEGLTVDTFPDESGEEMAWVGLVPFLMQNIRLRGTPAVPGTHTFPETNVRTYVHRDGNEPGVWFFSLDAANALACSIARKFFGLPYYFAQMDICMEGDNISYQGQRGPVGYNIEVQIHEELAAPQPGSLEFFLVERYLLYSLKMNRLYTGRVSHVPYKLKAARPISVSETLVNTVGIPPTPFRHFVYCAGVDVEIFPLSR